MSHKTYSFSDGPVNHDVDSPSKSKVDTDYSKKKGLGAKPVEGSPAEEAGESSEFEAHEVEDAYKTLQKAEKIKAHPKLMKHVAKHADEQVKHAKKFTSVKALRAEREKMNDGPVPADKDEE